MRLALPAPPVVTGFYRMLFATLLATSWLLAVRRRRGGRAAARGPATVDGRALALAAAAGLCFGTDLALWHTSIVHTSVATATLLVNVTPVHVGLYSLLVLRETLRRRFVAGAALAGLGTLVLLGAPASGGDDLRGAGLALAASLFYAGYLLLMKAARQGVPALAALVVGSAAATGALGAYAALRGDAFTGFPTHSWAAMLGAAVISQLGGVLGIVWALRYLPATLASVALLAQPVGTALLGWLLLGEALSAIQLAGGAAVLAGIALASRASGAARAASSP